MKPLAIPYLIESMCVFTVLMKPMILLSPVGSHPPLTKGFISTLMNLVSQAYMVILYGAWLIAKFPEICGVV